ncbi:hypothetical protein CSKR_108782 [Clonorchis sinensis]|uniref:BZIP domain-containing protein n=1 Tax=Clonorchis sinensis TaxID=79923 RepID=A0A8T1MP01_CLOSI|nr:hypothetical protein CSKR_108782 [Clonorchis sinensis]
MSATSSPTDVSPSSISANQQTAGAVTSSGRIASFNRLSAGVPSYGPSSSPAMSAAAAAAFLLQAATGGSVNGEGSAGPVRRSSARFFESPQSSPSFPSAVISAAAQQAALAAAAQAISSSHSSPSAKASSDLQAAVISLALAANPPTSSQSDLYRYDQQDPSSRPSQAVTDLFFLSERHPELLKSHPSLASVFRRRSSTVLPTYLSELSNTDGTHETIEKPVLNSDPSFPHNLVSALEVIHSQNSGFSDVPGQSLSPTSMARLSASRDGSSKEHFSRDVDPYRFSQGPSVLSPQNPKFPRHFPPTTESTVPYDRNFSRVYRGSPGQDMVSAAYPSHNPYDRSTTHSNLSPTSVANVTESGATLCRSPSPLSCSSLSNSATPRLNISPMGQDGRNRSMLLDSADQSTKSGTSYASVRAGCLSEHEIKTEYSVPGSYADEPNRKREQRLIKNREAARECRRKKKEYVKCLEARVSLLESQNQQLIEELQKVKALCFNELCGLGLTNSTAACAAAVLAAVTSVPGTYSAPSASTAMKSSPSDVAARQMNNESFGHTTLPSDESQLGAHLLPLCRSRTRRRSILSATKFQSDVTSLDSQIAPDYPNDYIGEVDSAGSQLQPFPPTGATQRQNGSQQYRDAQSRASESTSAGVSPSSYDSVAAASDSYRQHNHAQTASTIPTIPREDSKRIEQSPYSYSPPAVQAVSRTSTYFHHPHYAAKRAYRNLTVNTDEPNAYTDPQTSSPEHGGSVKSTRSANTVADAAVILAAAAAMVAESESTSNAEPRVSS